MDAPLFTFSTKPLNPLPLMVTETVEPASADAGAEMETDALYELPPCPGVAQLAAALLYPSHARTRHASATTTLTKLTRIPAKMTKILR